jgi:hypothetical protein
MPDALRSGTMAPMDPRTLFPLLAAVFAVLAIMSSLRRGSWRGAPFTWGLIALIFALVAAWLRWAT